MKTYYVPKYRYELEEWLNMCADIPTSKLKKMSIKQLYAVYHNIRRQQEQ